MSVQNKTSYTVTRKFLISYCQSPKAFRFLQSNLKKLTLNLRKSFNRYA